MGDRAANYRCVSASEAVNPSCAGAGIGGNPVKVIFLYGSWNKRCCSIIAQEAASSTAHVAMPVVEKLRRSLLKEETSSMGNNVLYLSVKVDDDDECIDVCTRSSQDGGLEAPPELPCLLLLAHPPPTNNNNAEMRVEHVECRNLEQALVDDFEVEPGKRPASSIATENLEASLKEAWSRLFDVEGNLLPPQPKQSKRRKNTNTTTRKIKNNEPAIRIFVAGDRSQVGKSSICMVSCLSYHQE